MSLPESIRASMSQTNKHFSTAVVGNGDFDAIDDVYTLDARVLPPGAPTVEGRPAIKGFWRAAVAGMGLASATLTTIEAQLCGDDVVEIGRADLTLKGGQVITGKYLVHWKQEDGKWKWRTDIWNTNS
jgi:ketosteroid isomerase-like protein